jgi:hypothetical protein
MAHVRLTLAAIRAFANQYHWLADPAKARNRCVDASIAFLHEVLGLNDGEYGPFIAHNNHRDPNNWHAWVKIGHLNIDWTARQFFEWEEFPAIWLDKC